MLWIYRLVLRKDPFFKLDFSCILEGIYENTLRRALSGKTPYFLIFGTLLFLVCIYGWSLSTQRTKVEFFPDNKPNQIIVYIEYPEGTDIEKTNRITEDRRKRVFSILMMNYIWMELTTLWLKVLFPRWVKAQVTLMTDIGTTEMPNKGKITASMREFKYRRGLDSEELRQKVQRALVGIYPGVLISVEKMLMVLR